MRVADAVRRAFPGQTVGARWQTVCASSTSNSFTHFQNTLLYLLSGHIPSPSFGGLQRPPPVFMRLHVTVFLTILAGVSADVVNRTIDDQYGDEATGAQVRTPILRLR